MTTTTPVKTLCIDINIDRSVPLWPEVRQGGITPAGFHHLGNRPCFGTKNTLWHFYVPHYVTTDEEKARMILEQVMRQLPKEHYRSHLVSITLDRVTTSFWLEIAAASVLIATI